MFKNNIHRIILCVVASIIILFSAFGEKVAHNDGAGWDGLFYREVSRSFSKDILAHKYDKYHIQRIAPFAIVNVSFEVFDILKSNENLMYGISFLNILVAFLGMFYYFKLATCLKFSIETEIIGFSSIFFIFSTLKLQGYYPFLTDLYAMVFAIMQVYYFVNKKIIPLLIVGIIGAFTWPTLLLFSLIFALFSNIQLDIVKSNSNILRQPKIWFALQALAPLMFLFAVILLYAKTVYINHKDFKSLFIGPTTYVYCYNLVLSVCAVLIYFYLIIKPIQINIQIALRTTLAKIDYKLVILVVCSFLILKISQSFLSNGETGFGLNNVIYGLITRPLTAPFVFIINHFMAFGIAIILFIIFYKKVLVEIQNLRLAYFVVFVISIIFSLGTESRCFINNYIYLLIPLLLVLNKLQIHRFFMYSFVAINLLLSRFWYQINVTGIEEAFKSYNYNNFPAQRYFMNFGPWQSHYMYLLFLLIFIICLTTILVFRKSIFQEK